MYAFTDNNQVTLRGRGAAAVGGGGAVGAYLSAGLPDLPAGAVIVLVAAALFLFSMLLGRARGVMRPDLDPESAAFLIHETIDAAANQIGDKEMARTLLGGESRIEVLAELEPDPESYTKYKWTSGLGPQGIEISPGTTAQVRVTIEELAPITLILPFLKSASGL